MIKPIKTFADLKRLPLGTQLLLKSRGNQVYTPGSEPKRILFKFQGRMAVLLNEQAKPCYLPISENRSLRPTQNGFQILSYGRVVLEYQVVEKKEII